MNQLNRIQFQTFVNRTFKKANYLRKYIINRWRFHLKIRHYRTQRSNNLKLLNLSQYLSISSRANILPRISPKDSSIHESTIFLSISTFIFIYPVIFAPVHDGYSRSLNIKRKEKKEEKISLKNSHLEIIPITFFLLLRPLS